MKKVEKKRKRDLTSNDSETVQEPPLKKIKLGKLVKKEKNPWIINEKELALRKFHKILRLKSNDEFYIVIHDENNKYYVCALTKSDFRHVFYDCGYWVCNYVAQDYFISVNKGVLKPNQKLLLNVIFSHIDDGLRILKSKDSITISVQKVAMILSDKVEFTIDNAILRKNNNELISNQNIEGIKDDLHKLKYSTIPNLDQNMENLRYESGKMYF